MAHVVSPIVVVLVLYFAMQHVVGTPPKIPEWTFPEFFFWIAGLGVFYLAYMHTQFETIDN